ncbi:MAG: plastocyanin/azurin family copper-binding protein [Actinomycetota bacterium]
MSDTSVTEKPESEEAAPPARTPFWERPAVEALLVPLLLPAVVVLGVVVIVMNVSRIFLATHGNLPTIIGTVVLMAILIGATVLSASKHLSTQTIVLLVSVFVVAMMSSGWITLGKSEAKKEPEATALPADLKTTQVIKMTGAPGGAFSFSPASFQVKTGLARVEITWAAPGHAAAFYDEAVRLGELLDEGAEATSVGVAYFGEEGEYEFYCPIPGHAAAGMKGIVDVTGPVVTLEQALTDAGNPPDAVPTGGETGGE